MAGVARRIRSYLAQPQTGAGLLFVALAFGIVRLWLLRAFADSVAPAPQLFHSWTLVSFFISTWLAFLLLRRVLTRRAMQRVLLIAVVHAAGALRFYDWGLLLLSVLPLFALVPALLFPAPPRPR